VDSEAVVINESGQSDFSALESYVSSKSEDRLRTNLVFYAFNILYLDAMDLRRLPLLLRKEALHELLLHQQSPLVCSRAAAMCTGKPAPWSPCLAADCPFWTLKLDAKHAARRIAAR
jgi:bifunctional non-homologous end joining protein LigD